MELEFLKDKCCPKCFNKKLDGVVEITVVKGKTKKTDKFTCTTCNWKGSSINLISWIGRNNATWISVKEQKPPTLIDIYVCSDNDKKVTNKEIFIGFYAEDGKTFHDDHDVEINKKVSKRKITHWMYRHPRHVNNVGK